MEKLTYREALAKFGGIGKNACDYCNKVVAFEPLSSLRYAEHSGDLFVFCSGKCRSNMIKRMIYGITEL